MKHYLQQLCLFAVFFIVSCNKEVDKLTVDEKILEFKINDIEGKIDEETSTIKIVLPYETNLKNLVPVISFSGTPQIVPTLEVPQNFNSIVYYTLIGANGAKKVYKVIAEVETQPSPQIFSILQDSVEAGYHFEVIGKYFGSFPLDIKIEGIGPNTSIPLKFEYQSDTLLKVKTAIGDKPDDYRLKISVKNKSVESSRSFRITQAAPQLVWINGYNFFPPDEIKIVGKYLDPSKFSYSLQFLQENDSTLIPNVRIVNDTIKYKLPENFKAGKFLLKLKNLTDYKESREKIFFVQIYSGDLPFAKLIPKNEYKSGDNIQFNTYNYTAHSYRFYQVNISSATQSYVQNGVFDNVGSTLSIKLPSNIQKGTYSISHSLSDPSKNLRYEFTTDDTFIIK